MDALPPDTRQELVMSAAALDGHSVTTHRFRAAGGVESLVASLRERWLGEGVRFVESRQGDWVILSARDPAGMHTVQLRATAAGTEGLSSRWRRAGAAPDDGSEASDGHAWPAMPALAWLPGDARLLRRITHRDPGRDAATAVAIVEGPAERAALQLRRRATSAGFAPDPAVGMPAQRAGWYRGGAGASGEAMAFRRQAEEVVITIAPHRDGAAVVLHWSVAR
jgi:hypothetical protein